MCVPIYIISTKWRLQTALSAKHCFHHANGNVTTIVPLTNAYEINHIWELRKWNQMKNDPRSCERSLYNYVRSLKKEIKTSTGFEPVTSQYRCDALTSQAMKLLIVPLFFNPENNGLQSVCSLHFVLSTNLYIKDQQDMSILIFLKLVQLGNRGSIIQNVIYPFNPDLKPLNCHPRFRITVQNAQNNYSAYLKFLKVSD